MRRLLLLRHAKAVPSTASGTDPDRKLEPRGHDDARRVGAYLAKHSLIPSRALLSPAARVQETWFAIAGALGASAPAALKDPRLYNASADDILSVIQGAPAGVFSLIVVGHNPGLHELAVLLTATGDTETRARLRAGLPTSGLAVIDFVQGEWSAIRPQSGRLERFISPEAIDAATD